MCILIWHWSLFLLVLRKFFIFSDKDICKYTATICQQGSRAQHCTDTNTLIASEILLAIAVICCLELVLCTRLTTVVELVRTDARSLANLQPCHCVYTLSHIYSYVRKYIACADGQHGL